MAKAIMNRCVNKNIDKSGGMFHIVDNRPATPIPPVGDAHPGG